MQTKTIQKRIQSIDILRGIAMVLMALDHVRDYFHITAWTDDPLNLETTTPALFFTRWITHFCAPTFVFLSGVSIYLQSLRKTKNELSIFLMKRGLWLVFLEVTVISLGWSYNPNYNFIFLQVIWVIGISMFLLGLLIQVSYEFILGLGLLFVFGHNLLDFVEAADSYKPTFLWDLLHHGNFAFYNLWGSHTAVVFYPIIPWSGLMMLGYCAGILFTSKYSAEQRAKILIRIGAGLLLLFVVLRLINVYGNPVVWSTQKTNFYTFLSIINVHKYPPSLMYMCITIGIALLVLVLLEKMENRFTRIMSIFGRTAFFYYILHLYLIHFLCMINFYINGHSVSESVVNIKTNLFYFITPGEGYGLIVVYIIWITVILALFPLCKWYDNYKQSHKEKWWLSYL
ncbi:MAG: DUF1624 domain-containing protein [Lentimicrobium sp.]|jgi:uncharacterized membrane protein|nr:DUF1624 domain-containing protein [Lentimicrobium sp.]